MHYTALTRIVCRVRSVEGECRIWIIIYIFFKYVSCEFINLKADTHLCKLCDTPAARFTNGLLLDDFLCSWSVRCVQRLYKIGRHDDDTYLDMHLWVFSPFYLVYVGAHDLTHPSIIAFSCARGAAALVSHGSCFVFMLFISKKNS